MAHIGNIPGGKVNTYLVRQMDCVIRRALMRVHAVTTRRLTVNGALDMRWCNVHIDLIKSIDNLLHTHSMNPSGTESKSFESRECDLLSAYVWRVNVLSMTVHTSISRIGYSQSILIKITQVK